MASVTIRNFPDRTKELLRVKAAKEGISLEAYARKILNRAAQKSPQAQSDLLSLSKKFFGKSNHVELELPKRSSHREIVDFSK